MAVFSPKDLTVVLNGVEISDWADGGDTIVAENGAENGQLIIGNDGRGIFVANVNESGTLTLKLKQHSPDNEYLSKLHAQQKNSIRSFVPFELTIKDINNEDIVTGSKGYFTQAKNFTRGDAHNPTVWVIAFERLNISFARGSV